MDELWNIELTVICCLLDSRFIFWAIGGETHEVKPTHMQRQACKEINRHKRCIVNVNMGAFCGSQGNNSTQCCATMLSLSSRQLTTRASPTSG